MITARIVNSWDDGDGTDSTIYEIEVDSPYNPDIADDLIKRVTNAAKEDREHRTSLYGSDDDES